MIILLNKKIKDKQGGINKVLASVVLLAITLFLIKMVVVPQTNTTVEIGSKANAELEKLEEIFK